MPQAVPIIATALVKIGVSATIAKVVAAFAVKLAFSAAMSALTGALQPKPKVMDQGQVLQNKVQSAYPREIAVGPFATGGSLSFENVSGANNRYYWRIFVLSDYEITAVDKTMVGKKELTFDGDVHTGLRGCTNHFLKKDGVSPRFHMRIYKGTQAQTADPDLLAAFAFLTANFRGRGIAYALCRFDYDTDAYQGGMDLVWAGRGAPIYDTRTGVTAYTANGVLIGRQYLKGFYNNGFRILGMGVADRDVPVADYSAAADECDVVMTLKDGVTTEAKYTVGGMISARESPREVIAHIVAAIGGCHIDRGGEVVLLPGVTRTPIMDIAATDLVSATAINYAAKRTSDERFNVMAGSTFVKPADGYLEAPLPIRKDTAAIAADNGERLESSRAYKYVTSFTQGQRLDQIELRKARAEGFLAIEVPLWAFELTPGDVFTMTHVRWGSVQKYWEVQTVQLTARMTVAITANETTTSVYSWNAATDELPDSTASASATYTASVPAPVGPLIPSDAVDTATGKWTGGIGGTEGDIIAAVSEGTYQANLATSQNASIHVVTSATWEELTSVDVSMFAGALFGVNPTTNVSFGASGSLATAKLRLVETDTSNAGAVVVFTSGAIGLDTASVTEWFVPASWTAATEPQVRDGTTRRYHLEVQRNSGTGSVVVAIGDATLAVGLKSA